jgi:hypothetical protein
MHRVRSSTTTAVRTPRRLRSLWRLRVGAVAGLGLATTLALLPSGPAFGAGVHHRRPAAASGTHRVARQRRGKPVLSNQPADYIPATISGHKVVIDPRSPVHTDPSCQIPPDGVVVNPLSGGDAVQVVIGGLWDCPAGPFVSGIAADKAATTVPKLSRKSLYAPPNPVDAGSVKTTTVKVNGKRVKVFTYRVTIPTGPNAPRDAFPEPGWQLLAASTEPHAHLLISATTPSPPSGTIADPDGHVWYPVRYLTAMLKAGAGKAPRAG